MSIMRHMVQLDGLRALAVLAVLLSHFGGSDNLIAQMLPWGAMGVRLFFVLSGFLITGILLQCRNKKIAGQASGGQLLGKFYTRRFLRIFPVYYALLIAITLLNIRPVRELFWWHLTYLSNFHFALLGGFQGPGSHFWSLAVEEQFYLVWPWLILFTPQRWLVPLNVAMVVLAVGFRSIGVWLGYNNLALQILPIGCLDALGMGSLLAVLTTGGRTWSQPAQRFASISFWCGLSLSAFLSLADRVALGRNLEVAWQVFGLALIFVALVAWGAQGMSGWVGKFLGWRPLVYIGKISYGMYLYHAFMPVVGPRLFGFLGLPAFYQRFDGTLNTALTIALASASWHFFEAPINRLKERFSYAGERGKLVSDGLALADSGVSKTV
jgi:peptidoglycan/LPS O-acetylase OafA/YrhL